MSNQRLDDTLRMRMQSRYLDLIDFYGIPKFEKIADFDTHTFPHGFWKRVHLGQTGINSARRWARNCELQDRRLSAQEDILGTRAMNSGNRKKKTPERKRQGIVRRLKGGASIRDVVDSVGCGHNLVQTLAQNDLKLRPYGRKTMRKRQ